MTSPETCPICGREEPEVYAMQTLDADDLPIGPKRWYCRNCGERIDDQSPVPAWLQSLIDGDA